MYGVVLAYGFSCFNIAWTTNNYLLIILFFFSYSVIIVDWLYVQPIYTSWDDNKYTYPFFIIDLFILFIISRLIYASINNTDYFWLWLSALYFAHVLWDIFIKFHSRSLKDYSWRAVIISDVSLFVLFLIPHILLSKGFIELSLGLVTITIIVYIIFTYLWGIPWWRIFRRGK